VRLVDASGIERQRQLLRAQVRARMLVRADCASQLVRGHSETTKKPSTSRGEQS
jgi:hypothetical protein